MTVWFGSSVVDVVDGAWLGVAVVDVGADGRPTDVELRSDDVSPSGLETAFARCMERALAARTFDPPTSQPAIVEIAFEYARTVPDAHQPGGRLAPLQSQHEHRVSPPSAGAQPTRRPPRAWATRNTA